MPRITIKTKFLTIVILLVACFVIFNGVIYPCWVQDKIEQQAMISARQAAETASLAIASPLQGKRVEETTRIMEGLNNIPAFKFSAIFDPEGRLIDSTPSAPNSVKLYSQTEGRSKSFVNAKEGFLMAVAPIFLDGTGPPRTGTLVLGFSTEDTQRIVKMNIWLGMMAGFVLLGIGFIASYYVDSRYIQPIAALTSMAGQVSAGNLEASQVKIKTGDELEALGTSFELMTQKLRVARDEIERQNKLLEFRVQERTRQLMESIWELEETRSSLEHTVQERTKGLEQSQAELRAWAETLENKVKEKTNELLKLNESLLQSFQKLQQVDRLKDEFLANMSHELRTPLNAVIGFSGLLLQESSDRLPEDMRDDLGIILQNGQDLLTMIDAILDLSKIEAGNFDIDTVPLDPLPILQEVETFHRDQIQDKPLELVFEKPNWPMKVHGDPGRLKQVFKSLLGNAIKFTEKGTIRITASKSGDLLRISFKDTGIGMSQEEMNRLFKPFQQVDGSITRRFGGTGLGLALSQKLIGLMHGRITVESTKGVGSNFTVEIPLHFSEV